MNCEKIQQELWEFKRGELSAEVALEVRRHLEVCTECTAFLEGLKHLDFELDRFGELKPSPVFDQKLNARLEADSHGSSWHQIATFVFNQRYALSFVLLLVTTVGIWVGFRHRQTAKLNSLEDVLRVQEKYLGSAAPSQVEKPVPPSGPAASGDSRMNEQKDKMEPDEQVIPDEDRPLVENIDLLENYEFLKKFELADSPSDSKSSVEAN